MSMPRTRYCVANWKMNFTLSEAKSFLSQWQNKDLNNTHIKTIFCPSFTGLFTIAEIIGKPLNYKLIDPNPAEFK